MKKVFLCMLVFGFYVRTIEAYCPFCDEKVLAYQEYYQDELVLGLYTHKPVTDGHCLIIPKRHVERFDELTDEEVSKIFILIKKTQKAIAKAYNKDKYLLLQKNGKEVGQSVPHVHFHVIPALEGQIPEIFWAKFAISNLFSPISRENMKENIAKIKNDL